jgi:ABC-type anion transport system duplicated permease subunit
MAEQPEVAATPETLDLIYELVRDAPRRQIANSYSYSDKAFQIFGIGSLVLGLAAAGTLHRHQAPWILLAALIAYLGLGVCAFYATKGRTFFTADNAEVVWGQLYDLGKAEAQHAIIDRVATDYPRNEEALRAKAKWLTAAEIALAVEVVLVTAAVIAAVA